MQTLLEKLTADCQALSDSHITAINDLALLLERHALNKYDDETFQQALSHRPDLAALHLNGSDVTSLKHFLFFLLMNYPDRAALSARCLVKCYDASLTPGICQAIAAYWQQDDAATCRLTDAITYAQGYDQFSETVLTWFKKLHTEGLPETRKTMSQKFSYYKKFYGAVL